MNLNKFLKKELYHEHYDGCPIFMKMCIPGFTTKFYNSKIPAFTIILNYFKNGEGDWFTLVSDQQKIGKYIISEFIKGGQRIKNLHRQWLKNFKLMLKFYYQEYPKNLSSLTNQKFLNWVDNFYKLYENKVVFPGLIDGYMFYADKRLNTLLRDFCVKNNISNYPKIFSILSSQIKPSFIIKQQKDLKKIIRLIPKNNLEKSLKINKKIAKLINNHLLIYSWTKSGYFGYQEYTIKDIKKEIKELSTKKHLPRLGKAGENPFQSLEKNKTAKAKFIKKYKFTPEIIAISRATELLLAWQDQRKIYTLTFVTLLEKSLKEINKRTKIDLELLRYCQTNELKNILTDKFNKDELKKRKKSSLFIYQKGKTQKIITGKRAKNILNNIKAEKPKKIKEIKGISACLGKVTGKVKIIKSAKYINKIKHGDILVAPMTRPEHLTGMKKVVAIVTDDGGITCHAAIMSRELNIPCIIATKIATQVLKDGDRVEVNANKGIVKILKQ